MSILKSILTQTRRVCHSLTLKSEIFVTTGAGIVAHGDCLGKQQIRGYQDRKMRRDVKFRAIAARAAPERRRLEGLMLAHHVLPPFLREEAKSALDALPRRTNPVRYSDCCAITSRARGKVMPWRLSRFVFREEADHGRLCGVKRALWGTNRMKNRDSLI